MSISARIPLASMAAANATLAAQGFGPGNFSVPVFTDKVTPTHATLHAWGPDAFVTALKALPGVVVSEAVGTPQQRVEGALAGVSGRYGSNAPLLEGQVTPGLYRREGGDVDEQELWLVIQPYDTAVWPDPSAPGLLALVRRARIPGEVLPWVQPIDQFDAYKLVNAFTGEPDEALHNGSRWRVTQADGAGNNVWAPGVFGWTQVTDPPA